MFGWLLQIGLFVAMFAVPCVLFWISTLLAQELRDFFESSVIAIAAHALITLLVTMGIVHLVGIWFSPENMQHFGLVIRIGVMVLVTAWVFGGSGCLYDEQAPHKRIGARGLKRYR